MSIGTAYRFLTFPPTRAAFREYLHRWKPVLANLISSDVYTMASAISTCAVISFFPFMILLISIVHAVETPLNFSSGTAWITTLIEAYLPASKAAEIATEFSTRGFGRIQLISALILILSAMGVFIPIEVTLNRIWEASKNMSFIKNQLVSFGVVLLCGLVSLVSFVIGGINFWLIKNTLEQIHFDRTAELAKYLSIWTVGFLLSIALFFVVFSLLPNKRIPFDTTVRASIFTGILWNLGRYVYLRNIGKLHLTEIYGFYYTTAVVLILWTYVSAMIMILGAELAHRELLSLRLFRPAYEEWKLLHADGSRLD